MKNLRIIELSFIIAVSMFFAACGQQTIRYHLSPFQDEGSKLYGLVNDDGRIIVPAVYDLTTPSEDSLCLAITEDGMRVYLDCTGEVVSHRAYYKGGRFNDNRAYVFDSEWGNCIIDKDEQLICKIGDGFVYGFKDGLCMLECDEKFCVIDQNGKVVFPMQSFEKGTMSIINGGHFVVYKENGCTVYDQNGRMMFESPFVVTEYFDGVFCTSSNNGDNGLLDITGKPVTTMNYSTIIPVGEGMANVNINGEWCFINSRGETLLKHEYGWEVNEFSNGRAAVRVGRKYGFINKEGALVIPCRYDDIEQPGWNGVLGFNGSFAHVTENGESFYIDKEGRRITFY